MPKKLETIFKEKALRDLKTLDNIWFLKTQEVSVRGIPDILACVAGVFVAIELKKSARDTPDELQKYNLKRIKKAWGKAFTAHPGNWNKVFKEVAKLSLCG